MSSILTNNSAMVALQTLKGINKNLGEVQSQISTGKAVGSAKDNAAVWSISKTMESDVAGFKAISSSLSLGESTVSVGRQAAETVTDLLTQMKDKIVASQEDNVDRDTIQKDISALRDQIGSVVGAAQFNGLNLLSNTDDTAGSGTVNVLSSLDRSGTGVAASDISVGKQDLGQSALTLGTTAGTATTVSAATAAADGGTATYDFTASDAGYGTSYAFSATVAGETITAEYVQRDGETAADSVKQMASRLNTALAEAGVKDVTYSADPTDANKLMITNNTDTAINTIAGDIDVNTGGTAGGGLEALADIKVTTEDGAAAALSSIEGLIQKSIESAASFGSAQGRIETQKDFISGLTDALKSGIGTLVDANMEEASARLQALQVQQQLGTQSLSIANQAPQQLLSLFR